MEDRPLADLFEPADRARWLGLVEGALKGADFEKTLVSRTSDGLRIEPLYPAAEPAVQPVRAPGPWRIAQRVDHPDPAAAGAQALTDLEGGADALVLAFSGALGARGYGLTARTVEDLDAALKGVMLPLVAVRVDAGAGALEAATLMRDLAARRGEDLSAYELDLGIDPVGTLAATGSLGAVWGEIAERLAAAVSELEAAGFRGRALLADGRPYHEAGAGEAAELGAVLATAVAYLRALEAAGHDLATARDRISVLLVADADEFVTVAKFRAMRRLWARVEQACGLDPKPLTLHAETAWRMMTRRDPFVNILRGGMAAAAAGMGGADAVAVLPYTAALGLPDAFARRVARNAQVILIEESHLARVSDPAAGAGGFEALTAGLAEAAWEAFQAIEAEGGIVASLSVGKLQRRIETAREVRAKAVATLAEPLTGASAFPNLAERPVAVLDVARVTAGPASNFGSGSAVACDALPSQRLAEPFEALRDASDAALAKTGRRPAVFLANLGPIAVFNARATFAANAFAAGGIEALTNQGFSDPQALAEAFRASGATLACICSSDKIYAEQAVEAARALKAAGAETVYLAGRPGDLADPLKAAGVHAFLYAGGDLLAFLNEALRAALRAPPRAA
ncbi:methylmalonyl-CoA mutase subunit beta [Methylobacterium sp. NEAU 140]|uniref:methylmalonyl-CoA mutase subunit beta n=1 Tax=Methylobacterium sp. NEAU 140 TaxID=3064945 RepID=UPI0027367CF1|nr:methylmalonyl-CoA mutase subunit beta [Methylobacterium sp. NEAU 140]MDP4022173.1 methylmalonyl-CoA mutase subunit beta [Methylobacterium sp. NEAU 140]